MARRHRWRRQAYQRFPTDVADALLNAGWHPGRRLPDGVLDAYDTQIRTLGHGPDRPGFFLHDAARAVLTEFGSLRIHISTPVPEPTDGLDPDQEAIIISFPPAEELVGWALLDDLDERVGLPICPLGTARPHQHEELAIDSVGRVFSVSAYTGDAYLVAETFDDALVSLARISRKVDGSFWLVVPGGLLAEVTFAAATGMDLTGRYRDRAGIVTEPAAPAE